MENKRNTPGQQGNPNPRNTKEDQQNRDKSREGQNRTPGTPGNDPHRGSGPGQNRPPVDPDDDRE